MVGLRGLNPTANDTDPYQPQQQTDGAAEPDGIQTNHLIGDECATGGQVQRNGTGWECTTIDTGATEPGSISRAGDRPYGFNTGTSEAATDGASSVGDILRPGGVTIGKAGTDDTIREITGGLGEAQAMFQQLSHGGAVVAQTSKLTRVELPSGGGFVQLRREMSRSPNTAATIDVNIPGLDIRKLK
ncbi:hypothetical protein LY41_003321 [Prauserella halophila]|nr:hypothetical protein [Prauserella halophila]